MVQCKGIHAVELHPVRQQALRRAVHVADGLVQLLRGIPLAPNGAVILLGDKFHRRAGLAIDAAAVCNATLGIHGVDDLLRHRHLIVKRVPAGLELSCVRQDEVTGSEVGSVFVHVEAAYQCYRHGQQDHRQGKGENGNESFAPAAAQIGPGHGQQGHSLAAPFSLPLQLLALGVAHRLHRGDLARQTAGTATGDEYRHQGKDGRTRKEEWADRDHRGHPIEPRGNDRCEHTAQQPSQQQPDGDTDEREQQRLGADNPPELPGRGADGFQQAVETDVPRHGDLKYIVDDEISGEQNEDQHPHDDGRHSGVQLV